MPQTKEDANRGRECVWGLTQKEYIRALKSAGDGEYDGWLHERWLSLKQHLKENMGVTQYHAWTEAAAVLPPPDMTEQKALDLLRAHDKAHGTNRVEAWINEFWTNPPPPEASCRGHHEWVIKQPGVRPKGKTTPDYADPKRPGAAKTMIDSQIGRLVASAKKETAGPLEEIRWAHANMLKEYPEIDASSVPSPGAVTELVYAKEDRAAFMRDHYAKTIPSRSEIDAASRMQDAGRDLAQREEQFLEAQRQKALKATGGTE